MSQVSFTLGGRGYTVSCASGQEGHIKDLAQLLDEKLSQLGASAATNLEAQNLLFAGLFTADELVEARSKAESVEAAFSEAEARLAKAEQAQKRAVDEERRGAQKALDALKKEADTHLADLSKELNNALASIATLERKVDKFETERADTKEKIKALEAALAEDKKALLAEKKAAEAAQSAEKKQQALQAKNEAKIVHLEGLCADLTAQKIALEEAASTSVAPSNDGGEWQEEIAQLKQQLQAKEDELAKLMEDHCTLSEALLLKEDNVLDLSAVGEVSEVSDAPQHFSAAPDPKLAPALERFAELLENCADKLESAYQGE